jgi:hypothetical protein
VSSIIVLVRAFGDASSKTVIRRHAAFFFVRDVASFGWVRTRGMLVMEIIYRVGDNLFDVKDLAELE